MLVGAWTRNMIRNTLVRVTCRHAAAMSTDLSPVSLNPKVLAKWREEFIADPKNLLAQKGFTNPSNEEKWLCPPIKVNYNSRNHPLYVFNHRVTPENKPITAQLTSGRCWLFASLNAMRLPFMKKYGIEEFEFSQSYLFFYTRIEASYCWLYTVVKLAKEGHKLGDQSFDRLYENPPYDGGTWPMFKTLVNKYGVVPKDVFPETYNSSYSMDMYDHLVKYKIFEGAKELFDLVAKGASDRIIQDALDKQLDVIYKLTWTCLGCVPDKFKFEYYKKDGSYQSFPEVTPLEFYDQFVRPTYDVNHKVYLSNYPYTEFYEQYTYDSPVCVVGGPETAYNNQPVDTLLKATTASLMAGEAVFFAADTSPLIMKRYDSSFDLNDFDYKLALNTEFINTMTKELRMLYLFSGPQHGMVFTAVKTDDKGVPEKFLVENSWGEIAGRKGMFVMTEAWFREYIQEVTVDKKFVPQNVLDVHKRPLKRLNPFGPNPIIKPIIPGLDSLTHNMKKTNGPTCS